MSLTRWRSFALLLVLLPVLGATPRKTTPLPTGNLLENGGFESGLAGHEWMPAAWDTFDSGLHTSFYMRDTQIAHGGEYAASVANVSNSIPMFHNWSQVVKVRPAMWNHDAVVSVWTRSMGVQGRAYVLVQGFRDTIQKMALEWKVPRDSAVVRLNYTATSQPVLLTAWQRQYFSDNETEWVKRDLRVFVPRGTDVLVVRAGIFGTGQVFVDDASLTIVDAAPLRPVANWKNLLADPGFEGDGDEWEYSMPPYEGLVLGLDTTFVHAGHGALHAHGGDVGPIQARTGACQILDARALWDKRVRLSAYIRTDSLFGSAYVKLYGSTPEGEIAVPTSKVFSGDTDWTLTTFEMDVPPETYVLSAWLMYNAPTPGRLYFDDASLMVVGPAHYLNGQSPRPTLVPLAVPGGR
ncbi:MAG: hypothetical protein HOP12_12960 [Candidatus Eisenbacteria bacterium]|uniref:CBM-cenC domain-containing protein n=1 Tax=Eiseniibacteriota bacterium TaxID=2212470 RepID=A0A849SSM1_UNCEI|nr:hypothetical protein [Candidatus Eisenbacteria bacterium]